MKIKTIKLSDGHQIWDKPNVPHWRVVQVTDSIEYTTGQYLERGQVEELCSSKQWKVTIVPAVK